MNEELANHVLALTQYIYTLAPEVRVVETEEIFEDEHANLEVYPPLRWSIEECRALQQRIVERVVDLHVQTGYLILVYVTTPEQQIAEAKQTIHQAQRRVQAAERLLSEAASLGLLSQPAEVVPV